MLDRRFILENAELVQENCRVRGAKIDVARFVDLEERRRALQQEIEDLARQANVVSKSIGQAKDASEREARKEEGRRLRAAKDEKQDEIDRLSIEADAIHRAIPNLSRSARRR